MQRTWRRGIRVQDAWQNRYDIKHGNQGHCHLKKCCRIHTYIIDILAGILFISSDPSHIDSTSRGQFGLLDESSPACGRLDESLSQGSWVVRVIIALLPRLSIQMKIQYQAVKAFDIPKTKRFLLFYVSLLSEWSMYFYRIHDGQDTRIKVGYAIRIQQMYYPSRIRCDTSTCIARGRVDRNYHHDTHLHDGQLSIQYHLQPYLWSLDSLN